MRNVARDQERLEQTLKLMATFKTPKAVEDWIVKKLSTSFLGDLKTRLDEGEGNEEGLDFDDITKLTSMSVISSDLIEKHDDFEVLSSGAAAFLPAAATYFFHEVLRECGNAEGCEYIYGEKALEEAKKLGIDSTSYKDMNMLALKHLTPAMQKDPNIAFELLVNLSAVILIKFMKENNIVAGNEALSQ